MTILFDLDGVLIDTESHYTYFWNKAGKDYLGIDNFSRLVKGQAIKWILEHHFSDVADKIPEIEEELDRFDASIPYAYIPGAIEFLRELKARNIPFAIVTSSNDKKMGNVRRVLPELWELADLILTFDHFSKSKPDPECFLKGMEILAARPEDTVVFEDSIHGINAGRAAGARVAGLATTNAREVIAPLCDLVIDDFRGFDLEQLNRL